MEHCGALCHFISFYKLFTLHRLVLFRQIKVSFRMSILSGEARRGWLSLKLTISLDSAHTSQLIQLITTVNDSHLSNPSHIYLQWIQAVVKLHEQLWCSEHSAFQLDPVTPESGMTRNCGPCVVAQRCHLAGRASADP